MRCNQFCRETGTVPWLIHRMGLDDAQLDLFLMKVGEIYEAAQRMALQQAQNEAKHG